MNYGMIPQPVIDEVLRRHDIADKVGQYVHLTKHGKYLKGLCPFHSEKTPSFTVTPEKQIFHCYGCGKGGNVIKFVMEMEGESFPEAVRRLAEEAGIPFERDAGSHEELTPKQQERRMLLEAHAYAARFFHYVLRNTEAGKPAMDYLRSRGFTDKLIEEFGLGYAPMRRDALAIALRRQGYDLSLMERGGLLSRAHEGDGYIDRFRDRIIFPIHNAEGRVVAFAGRLLGDGQPKYLNSPESPLFNKSRTLYRLHSARAAIRKSRQVVLFEGYADCIKAWSAGVHNGVASMGTALTAEHAALLRRFAEEAIICYDGDDAGQAAAHKSIPLLESAGLRVRVSLLPGRMDPDEWVSAHGPEGFVREIIDTAVSSVKFQLIYLRKSHILLEDEGKIRYLRDAVRIVARRDSATERELMLKELSQEFGVSLESLKQDVSNIRTQEKLAGAGDIPAGTWNNVWNEKRSFSKLPNIPPTYVTAERQLLSWMMQDAGTAALVRERLGERFLVQDHAALAAYLYAYYANGSEPDIGRYIASIQDDRLEQIASAIALLDVPYSDDALEGNIRAIERYALVQEKERLYQDMQRAEKAEDFSRLEEILSQIMAIDKKLREK
jgi:DNA primase